MPKETREAPIRFHFTTEMAESLTVEEYEAIEHAMDGRVVVHLMRPLMARFMVDEKLRPLPKETAMGILGRMKLTAIGDVINKFSETVSEAAVPKVSGTQSESPAPQETPPDSVSPAG